MKSAVPSLPSLAALLTPLALLAYAPQAQAQELVPQLEITFDTSIANTGGSGYYAPANIVAVWIEDQAGNFVKTVFKTQSSHAVNLTGWAAAAPIGDIDGISGATRLDHLTPLVTAWDVTNKAGTLVANGSYVMYVEMADSNSKTGTGKNHLGSFPITLDGVLGTTEIPAGNGFSNIAVTYELVEKPPEPEPDPGTGNGTGDGSGGGGGLGLGGGNGGGDGSGDGPEAGNSLAGGCSTSGSSNSPWALLLAFGLLAIRRRR